LRGEHLLPTRNEHIPYQVCDALSKDTQESISTLGTQENTNEEVSEKR